MMKKLFSKRFTLIELAVSMITYIALLAFLIFLVETIMTKRMQVSYNFKRININTTFNSNFSTMVCYYNNNEQKWIKWTNDVQYWKLAVHNSTNTDEENTLCNVLENNFDLYKDNFIDNLWQKNWVDAFILTRTNTKNLVTYKILYLIKVKQDNDNTKADYYLVRIWSTTIEWFLKKNDAHNMFDKLVKRKATWKFNWKNIENQEFWLKYDNVRINLVDDQQIDIIPGSSWWGWTSSWKYTFNYNYFLFQFQMRETQFWNLDYFLFKN